MTPPGHAVRLGRMGLTQSSLVRVGCILMIAAAGMRAAFTAWFELDKFGLAEHWPVQWSVGYVAFVVAYALALRTRSDTREHAALLILQSLTALYLVWLYPNFLITALLVVVAWQIAWSTTLRKAIVVAGSRAGGDEVRGSGRRHDATGADEHLRIHALRRQRRSSGAQRGKRAGQPGESERGAARDARLTG